MYADFTSKLLPKIADGLVITKDYFLDLFGRYVKYLIIHDLIGLVLCVSVLIAIPLIGRAVWKKASEEESDGWEFTRFIATFVGSLLWLTFFLGAYSDLSNLIKGVYIPEVRVYEELIQQRQSD